MADQMQDVKRRIKSVGTTERITGAMKLVSASKLRKAKARFEHSEYFLKNVMESIAGLFKEAPDVVPEQYIMEKRNIETTCFLVITGSSGLCGTFNGNVIRETEKAISQCKGKVTLVTVGSKGYDHFKRQNYEILGFRNEDVEDLEYDETGKIVAPLIEKYHKGELDEIILIYTSYVNTLVQEVIRERLLPMDLSSEDKRPAKAVSMEYDPSPKEVFAYLVDKYFQLKLYSAAIESSTCENAARRKAMETANENARDMLADLNKKYNRARQEQITGEILEIVSGSEAQV